MNHAPQSLFELKIASDLPTLVTMAQRANGWHGTLAWARFPHPRVVVRWLADVEAADSSQAWATVISVWANEAAKGSMSSQTADKYAQATEHFIRHAALNGHTSLEDAVTDVEEWVYSAVRTPGGGVADAADGTIRLRLSAVRRLYEQARHLGLTDAIPAANLSVTQGKKSADWRPATDDEIDVLQAVADMHRGTRTPCVFALAMCGASTGEIGLLTEADVDVEQRLLHLPGTSRTNPRTVTIHDDWALEVIVDQLGTVAALPGLDTIERQTSRVVPCSRRGQAAVQSSISQSLGELIRTSFPHQRAPGFRLTPSSIPAWAGVSVFRTTQDIAEVARFMGFTSLDLAAQTVQLQWETQDAPSHPFGPGRRS